jgi:hypothetical protein
MKPCGHAVPVDSFAQQPANLPTSTWSRLRRPHMPTRPAATFSVHFKVNGEDLKKGRSLQE